MASREEVGGRGRVVPWVVAQVSLFLLFPFTASSSLWEESCSRQLSLVLVEFRPREGFPGNVITASSRGVSCAGPT